jgi:hypothetical protein
MIPCNDEVKLVGVIPLPIEFAYGETVVLSRIIIFGILDLMKSVAEIAILPHLRLELCAVFSSIQNGNVVYGVAASVCN